MGLWEQLTSRFSGNSSSGSRHEEEQTTNPSESIGSNTNNQNGTTAIPHDNNNAPQQQSASATAASRVVSNANSTQRLQTTTSTTKTKTNDGANKSSQNLTPSVDNISHTPIPNKSAKGVAEFDDDNLSTTAAASTSSSPVSTLDSAKKDLDIKFSTADNNNNINATTDLEGVLRGVINAYFDGESGISVDYLKELLFRYRRVQGYNVRLVKAASNILADIDEGSINNDTSDPLHIQQKSRKRTEKDAAVSNIRADVGSIRNTLEQYADQRVEDQYKIQGLSNQVHDLEWRERITRGAREQISDQLDNVNSRAEDLQSQLSSERDTRTQITTQAGASIEILEQHIQVDSTIHDNQVNALEAAISDRDTRIETLEGELNNTLNTNPYTQVRERDGQITELREELNTRDASHQTALDELQSRLDSVTSREETLGAEVVQLSAEVVQLSDTLSTLETDHSNLDAQLYVMIEENIDLELSKTVAEDHRDDLIEQVNELTMESLAKDHAFELQRQGHEEELERLNFIHSLELQREAERAELELEQTQVESRGDAARAAERAELEVSRVKAEASEEVSSICLLLIMPCLNVDVCPISHRCIIPM